MLNKLTISLRNRSKIRLISISRLTCGRRIETYGLRRIKDLRKR